MASTIHPTAIIHPKAHLGCDVLIGPFCVIGAGVTVGDRCQLQSHVVIDGPTRIGEANTFFPFTSIGQRSQDLKYAVEPTHLVIGHHNVFRESCTVNRGTLPGTETRIGDHNHFLAYCHIAHDCVVGNHVIFSNNGTLAGHVIVEDHVILGGLTAVHQFCRLGRYAITGGCSKIIQDVPPFMIVDGNPAELRGVNLVGLQRHQFDPTDIRALKEAYKALFLKKPNLAEAIATFAETDHAQNPHVAHLLESIAASTRGVTR
jgi:UDP-N-acetylglucosamine acyltransferase